MARTREELLAAAGSRYTYPADTLAYDEAVAAGAERIALVGMGCHSSAPAMMNARRVGKAGRRFAFSIGLLCSQELRRPDLRGAVLVALDESESLALQPAALSFLAEIRPGSSALLERLRLALTRGGPIGTLAGTEPQRTAGLLIADQFAHNDEVYAEIIDHISFYELGRIVALCRGWPSDERIPRLLREAEESAHDGFSLIELRYAAIPADEIPGALSNSVRWLSQHRTDLYIEPMLGPLVARLSRDGAAERLIKDRLFSGTVPANLRVAVPQLLVRAGKFDQALSEWCRGEIATQAAMDLRELAFDIDSATWMSIDHALADLLALDAQ